MRIVLIGFFLLCIRTGKAQIINPRIWYIGYQTDAKKDTSTPDTAFHIVGHGSTILDFRQTPIGISRFGYALSHGACNVQLFDKNDSLVLYSNGSKIFNGKHRLVEGGDSLSYGRDWGTSPFAGNYYGEYLIRVYPSPMIALPSVNNSNQYYFISVFVSQDTGINYKLVYTLVDMSLNNGMGKVVAKEKLIKYGNFSPAITACRHGNGRDWWIISREYGKKNFTLMLLDSTGLHIASETQLSGWDLKNPNLEQGNATNRFSWDGTMFASFTHLGTELYDFDRCKGTLSNRREIIIPIYDSFPTLGGGGFSPNSKFIYTGNGKEFYQVELKNLKIRTVVSYDGYRDTPVGQTGGIKTDFGVTHFAADGKMYMSTTQTTRYLHVIENPNDTGVLCNFKQHAVKLLTYNNGLPHYPNYELGAVADKCGESDIQLISNKEELIIYPNPASESLIVESPKFKVGSIKLTNLLGQEMAVHPEPSGRHDGKGSYILDIRALPQGIYLLMITDKEGKVLKQEKVCIQH